MSLQAYNRDMADPARGCLVQCLRRRLVHLTCLTMLMTAALALLHQAYSGADPGAALLLLPSFSLVATRPSSALSSVEVSSPAKERPLWSLTHTPTAATITIAPHAKDHPNPSKNLTSSITTSDSVQIAVPASDQDAVSSVNMLARRADGRSPALTEISTQREAPEKTEPSTPIASDDDPSKPSHQNSAETFRDHSYRAPSQARPPDAGPKHSTSATTELHDTSANLHDDSECRIHTVAAPPTISPHQKTGDDLILDQLRAAKKAIITQATPESTDPNLYGVLYKNVTAFSKSYELMEKVFKVYVYRDGSKPLVHAGPTAGIYASEGQFIERMRRPNGYAVKDARTAHMFFMPYSVQHMVTHLYVPDSHTMLPLATFIKEYVNVLAARYRFWNRTQGADHFFVSCHDWGPATTRDHPALRKNAVKVVCNADANEEFVPGKDVSLPEVYLHSAKLPLRLGGPGHDKRPYLAFFAGQMHGRVRPTLLAHWKDKDPDMKVFEVIPKAVAKKVSYVQHMKASKYCLCAMGFEVNSPRIVEAIYYDCVPVIIADNFVLPFSDVLDWDAFSVTVPEREIPNLKSILTSIPVAKYKSMQTRLKHVRPHFVWHERPEKYDIFNMIMHSVWTSRLNRLDQQPPSASR